MVLHSILHCLLRREPRRAVSGSSLLPALSIGGVLLCLWMLSATQIWAFEHPRGDVFPLVEAVDGKFRLSYLDNDAWYRSDEPGPTGENDIAYRERSILWVKEFTARGVLSNGPVRGPAFVTCYDTDRFYGRPLTTPDFTSFFLRSDGRDWFMLPTWREKRSWDVSLVVGDWLHVDPVLLPWGKTEFVRMAEDGAESIPLGIQIRASDRLPRMPVQLSVDLEHVLLVVAPEYGQLLPMGTVLYGYQRSGGNHNALLKPDLKQPLPSPPGYADIGVPCIRRSNGRYYVAHLARTAMPSEDNEFAGGAVDVLLLEWSPKTGRVRTARLAEGIHSNTHLSFDLIGKRGLFAYHQTNILAFPILRSKIVTKPFHVDKLDWKTMERPLAATKPDRTPNVERPTPNVK
jgi:hypothetical protein